MNPGFQSGGIVERIPHVYGVPVIVNSGEMILNRRQAYNLNPDRKCYHARKSVPLKTMIKRLIK